MADKDLYSKVKSDLTEAGINDGHFQWYALMLGAMAKGITPGNRVFNSIFSNLLNDGEPLPGAVVAAMTNLAMDSESKLENADEELFAMPDSSVDKKTRLQVLADLSYGLTLGLSINATDGTMEKIKDKDLLADLATISEVSRVDTDAELDEEDLKNVLEFMLDVLTKTYQKNQ